MKCPHCEKEIPSITCPHCQAESPEDARYCMACGSLLIDEPDATAEDENGFDFESRVLCPDGTCTGIIVDGKCTECGRAVDTGETNGE